MNRYVWIFSLLASLALAVSTSNEVSPCVQGYAKLAAVLLGILAGYHYPAPPAKPKLPPGLPLLLLLLVCGLTAGCKMSGFGLKVSNATFGSLELDVDGGSIGNRPASLPRHSTTNKPALTLPGSSDAKL